MGLKFSVNYKLTLFTLLFIPILFSLGLWQLNRAEQKREIRQSWEALNSQPAEDLNKLVDSGNGILEFRKTRLRGMFIWDKTYLLENRWFANQLGVELVVPFRLQEPALGTDIVLVNLGWSSQKAARLLIEEAVSENTSVAGRLKTPSDSKLIEQSVRTEPTWPFAIVEIDPAIIASEIGRGVFPYLLQIDVADNHALSVAWNPINMSPSRHEAYAVQWFAMSAALAILWFFANTNAPALLRRLTIR